MPRSCRRDVVLE